MTDFGRRIALHSVTHEDGGSDEIEATDLEGRVNYVDRGDPSSDDWVSSDLTDDGTWYELDMSAIVPAGAVLVHINAAVQSGTVNAWFQFRQPGNSETINSLTVRTYVADIYSDRSGFIALSTDRKIEYRLSNIAWTNILLTVRGWVI